jgi:hypothetical protein
MWKFPMIPKRYSLGIHHIPQGKNWKMKMGISINEIYAIMNIKLTMCLKWIIYTQSTTNKRELDENKSIISTNATLPKWKWNHNFYFICQLNKKFQSLDT